MNLLTDERTSRRCRRRRRAATARARLREEILRDYFVVGRRARVDGGRRTTDGRTDGRTTAPQWAQTWEAGSGEGTRRRGKNGVLVMWGKGASNPWFCSRGEASSLKVACFSLTHSLLLWRHWRGGRRRMNRSFSLGVLVAKLTRTSNNKQARRDSTPAFQVLHGAGPGRVWHCTHVASFLLSLRKYFILTNATLLQISHSSFSA